MSKSLANSILALLVITWLAVGCGSGNGGAGSGAAYPVPYSNGHPLPAKAQRPNSWLRCGPTIGSPSTLMGS